MKIIKSIIMNNIEVYTLKLSVLNNPRKLIPVSADIESYSIEVYDIETGNSKIVDCNHIKESDLNNVSGVYITESDLSIASGVKLYDCKYNLVATSIDGIELAKLIRLDFNTKKEWHNWTRFKNKKNTVVISKSENGVCLASDLKDFYFSVYDYILEDILNNGCIEIVDNKIYIPLFYEDKFYIGHIEADILDIFKFKAFIAKKHFLKE